MKRGAKPKGYKRGILINITGAMEMEIKRGLANDFDAPVTRCALARTLFRLWLDGDIPISADDVKFYEGAGNGKEK